MRRTLAVLLAGIVACAESPVAAPVSEPDLPRDATPTPTVVASYTLVLVNGAVLPSESPTGAGQWDYDGAKIELEMALLVFYNDGTFEESWFHRRNGSAYSPQTSKGSYRRTSDSTLQIGSGNGATVMTLTATGLVWKLPGFTLTYELQK